MLSFATKKSTLHVLRLDYKDAEDGNQDMIYLSCAVPRRKNDVINATIDIFIEPQPIHAERGQLFSEPAPSTLNMMLPSVSRPIEWQARYLD